VNELKDMLKQKDLSTVENKSKLIGRLFSADPSGVWLRGEARESDENATDSTSRLIDIAAEQRGESEEETGTAYGGDGDSFLNTDGGRGQHDSG
jgi:hypothetical protein